MYSEFQFLSRNSVRWDEEVGLKAIFDIKVSIPQSEFCPLGPGSVRIDVRKEQPCFNSSVGILSVGTLMDWQNTKIDGIVSIPQSEFCPLGQDMTPAVQVEGDQVSIPQSEFCPLGPPEWARKGNRWWGFNSSVGILSVGT